MRMRRENNILQNSSTKETLFVVVDVHPIIIFLFENNHSEIRFLFTCLPLLWREDTEG